MKKILLIGLVALLLGAFVFAYSPDDGCYSNSGEEITCTTSSGKLMVYNQNTNQLTYNLIKGWNIIPAGLSLSDKTPLKNTLYYEGTSCNRNYLTGFIYSPTQKEYFLDSDTAGNTFILNESSNGYYYAQNGGVWMYSQNECKVSFDLKTSATQADLITGQGANKKIVKGWTFLTIMPWMKGQTINELMGDCTIENFNMWNVGTQNWAIPSKATSEQIASLLGVEISDGSIGTTYLIKTTSNCELMKDISAPPTLPN